MVHFASDAQAEGIICGHIHTASMRRIKDLDYYNTGDWVESLTALVEESDGTIKLLKFSSTGEMIKTLAVCSATEGIELKEETLAPAFTPEPLSV